MKKQSKKYLWGVLIVVVALVGIKVIASSASPVELVENAQLTISETSWDFGDIPMSEGITTRSISLKNDTDVPITITSMQTSCMCTTVQIVHSDGSKSGLKGMVGHGGGTSSLSETIQAGEAVALLVNFDPNAHGPNATGPITRNVELTTNSQAQPEVELTFSGNVIP
ncbi:MAG: hypothetical protein UY76_C0008G0005 [Candidatus Uhrbacteria bacterium GW2011_GWA2_52_8d]|uniref:DUF1573 domain-containing protein n=1 Tax=Candidatus Uhrbacteria bacterium GW2011_GWA2_52_8d TaxID=1618979 RepID=A0A0G1ZXK2_9BACT|nr:MAG: hypothetical protein UY76_C0008G0005 [Candidatus Uhrbacteria bacterium GW2011_GWA2_52_8d]